MKMVALYLGYCQKVWHRLSVLTSVVRTSLPIVADSQLTVNTRVQKFVTFIRPLCTKDSITML